MKKICKDCWYGGRGEGKYKVACSKTGTKVWANKQRNGCKYFRNNPPPERRNISYFELM